MSPWINFLVVICTQLLFFLLLAYQKRAFKEITPGVIVKNIGAGVVLGMMSDLFIGKYLGILNYVLGFHLLFLIMNGALAYGLWFLTLRLLRSESVLSFLVWNTVIALIYEVVNHFYPVWQWTFEGSFLHKASMILIVGYWGPALLVALIATLVTQVKFPAFRLRVGR